MTQTPNGGSPTWLDAIKRDRWTVIISTVVAGAVLAGVTLLMPQAWRARATLLLPLEDDNDPSITSFFKAKASPIEVLRGILDSHATRKKMAEAGKVDLDEIKEIYSLRSSPEENQIQIVVKNSDKEKGLLYVQTAINSLESLVRTNTVSMASRQAQYLRNAIAEREKELSTAEQTLLDFSRKAKTTLDPMNPYKSAEAVARLRENQLELQRTAESIKAIKAQAAKRAAPAASVPTGIPEIEEWRKKVEGLEYELRVKELTLGDNAPEYVQLKDQLAITRKGLQSSVSKYLASAQGSLGPELSELEAKKMVLQWENQTLEAVTRAAPTEAAAFSSLLRKVNTLTATLQNLRAQVELAQVKSEVEKVRWSVLDPPYIEEKPAGRGTILNAFVGAALGLLASGIVAIRRHVNPKANAS